MTPVREAWTDERLDDLSNRVESGFREIRGELSSLQRLMVQTTVGMCATMVTGFCGLAALIVSQG
jgi:hypothetical protein